MSFRIGNAGWSIPARIRGSFGEAANGLARYARRLDTVEINSSFYRPHRPETYARWAASTPDHFRFVILPSVLDIREAVHRISTFLAAYRASVELP